jgi:hypothetical protein
MPLSLSRAAHLAALTLVTLAGCRGTQTVPPPPPPAAPTIPNYANGAQVAAAMRDRYAGKWYGTLTFRQKTSRLLPNGTWNVQTWYEAIRVPGALRIDFDPVSGGNGVLYARDSQYVASNGRIIRAEPGINDLLLLGFDVYANAPARTVALLRKQGFDLSRVHIDSFAGRPMIVVGAHAGDSHRKQLWVDAERLYFVRLLEPMPRDSTKTQDIRFLNYERRGDAWVAPRVELYNDGKLVFYEDYSDVRVDVPLDDSLFDPARWKTAKHWVQ